MPSTKKRINLTVPDVIYERLQEYKTHNGITNDATACLQLIVQQLRAQENSLLFTKALLSMSADEIQTLSADGMKFIQQQLEQQTNDKR